MKSGLFALLLALILPCVCSAQTAPVPPGGRLTTNQGIAEMHADVVGATSIWYAPDVSGNISVYNGAVTGYIIEPINQSLNDANGLQLPLNPSWATANTTFDGYITGHPAVFCAVPWTGTPSDHAVPLAMTGGQLSNGAATTCHGSSGAITMPQYQGVYIGQFRTAAAGTIDFKFGNAALGGGAAVVSIWNAYNRVHGKFNVQDSSPSPWSPQTTPNIPANISGWEPLNLPCAGCVGGQHNNVTILSGGGGISATLNMALYPNVGANLYVGISINGAPPPLSGVWSKCANGVGGPTGTSNILHEGQAHCAGYIGEGLYVFQAMELGTSGTASGQFYSNQGGVTQLGGLTIDWEW